MEARVFYSWQSDCPGNTNRNFILTALDQAIKEIHTDDTIIVSPVMDRDTKGVPGSPDITESIFSKIDTASVFVCDISIINSNQGDYKSTPNPNVLIELGYAVKVLGWNRVIMVMNEEYGKPDLLPFDLRSKRITTYRIAQDAEEKAPERNRLRKILVEALKLIFEHVDERETDKVVQADISPSDIQLFKKFQEELPSNGGISFINQQNMAGFSWPNEKIDDLREFFYTWNNAEHEFLDSDLESLREKLYRLVGEYLGLINTNTFVTNNAGMVTVPPEWEIEDSKQFWEIVNKLHKTAGLIVEAHQEFIRKARYKFKDVDLDPSKENTLPSIDQKSFDGDYGKSDCEEKNYRYVGKWWQLSLLAFAFLPLIGYIIYSVSIGEPILSIGSRDKSLVNTFNIFTWWAFLFAVFLILPYTSDQFRISFRPKLGELQVGKKVYYFKDMLLMESFDDGVLRLTPKDGSREILLPLSRRATRYISSCINKLWNG